MPKVQEFAQIVLCGIMMSSPLLLWAFNIKVG
jgi:hypothetical protein